MKTFGSKSNSRSVRAGFTLVEMLVTMAVTLIVLLALVNAFQWIGERVGMSRAAMEVSGTLRGVGLRLQADLDSITVPVRPWPSQNSGLGYFEYIEGKMNDSYADPFAATPTQHVFYDVISGTNQPDSILGDRDDALFMTIHSNNEPFVGRVSESYTDTNSNGVWDSGEPLNDIDGNGIYNLTTTSYDAEVVWWVQHDDSNGNGQVEHGELVLRRRLLLIRPDADLGGVEFVDVFKYNDISAKAGNYNAMTMKLYSQSNSLADLTQRVNRFAHDARVVGNSTAAFPTEVSANTLNALALSGNNQGEDIMLSHLKAFDVRVFDPTARVQTAGAGSGRALLPGDLGWTLGGTAVGLGAFVDLRYNNSATSIFSKLPLNATSSAAAWSNATYDTWSLDYEQDGINQDNDNDPLTGNPLVDEGTDGLDNDNMNGVDDVGERETTPPYPVALRGLQVRIRVYEPDTRQVRQIAVTADFTPE